MDKIPIEISTWYIERLTEGRVVLKKTRGLFLTNDVRRIMSEPSPPGILTWTRVLNLSVGEISASIPGDFDFIFFIMSDATWSWPKRINKLWPKAKVFGLADLNIKSFNDYEVYENYPEVINNLNLLDGVIVSCDQHKDFFEYVLTVPVHKIQHPVDIDSILEHKTDKYIDEVGVFIHRYNRYTKVLWSHLRGKVNIFGVYNSDYYRLQDSYNTVYPIMERNKFYKRMGQMKAMINTQTWETMDRLSIEASILGVPVITQKFCSDSGSSLFPDIQVDDVYNLRQVDDMLNYIDHNRDLIMDKANKNIEKFGLKQAAQNFIEFWKSIDGQLHIEYGGLF